MDRSIERNHVCRHNREGAFVRAKCSCGWTGPFVPLGSDPNRQVANQEFNHRREQAVRMTPRPAP